MICSEIALSLLEKQKALNSGESGGIVPSHCCRWVDSRPLLPLLWSGEGVASFPEVCPSLAGSSLAAWE